MKIIENQSLKDFFLPKVVISYECVSFLVFISICNFYCLKLYVFISLCIVFKHISYLVLKYFCSKCSADIISYAFCCFCFENHLNDGEFERKEKPLKTNELFKCKKTSKDIWTPFFSCCSSYFSIKMSSFNTLKILIFFIFISSNNRVLLKTFFSVLSLRNEK